MNTFRDVQFEQRWADLGGGAPPAWRRSSLSLAACTWMIRSVDSDGDGSVGFEEFKTMMIGAGYIGAGGSLSQHKNSMLRLESLPDHYFFEALCNNFSKKVVGILFFFLLCSINCSMICKTMVVGLIKMFPVALCMVMNCMKLLFGTSFLKNCWGKRGRLFQFN